jgi:HKD family nuclease
MLIHQNPALANRVFDAISAGINPQTTEYDVAVAYVTREGAQKLVQALMSRIGHGWATIPKTLITCFDFGRTEPSALEYLQSQGFAVRIANLGAKATIQLIPKASSFHSKVYLAHDDGIVRAVIGSANLSRRAFSINTETIITTELTPADATAFWVSILESSVELTSSLLNSYKAVRPNDQSTPSPDEPPVPPATDPGLLPLFRDAVESGELAPNTYAAFWVEAGGLGSVVGNQLEMPRYAHRFFGFDFTDYGGTQYQIGEVTLMTANGAWNRTIAWHGHNRMERIYLPTPARSGLVYTHRVVLFQRSGTSFELTVAEPNDARAQQWHDESAATGSLYRLAERSNRICGFI